MYFHILGKQFWRLGSENHNPWILSDSFSFQTKIEIIFGSQPHHTLGIRHSSYYTLLYILLCTAQSQWVRSRIIVYLCFCYIIWWLSVCVCVCVCMSCRLYRCVYKKSDENEWISKCMYYSSWSLISLLCSHYFF